MRINRVFSAAIMSSALLAITACGNDTSADAPAATAGDSVTVHDAWVKAAESGMSSAFGGLENTSDADLTVVSASTEASTALELHETVENEAGEMIMREKANGFTIPSGQRLTLEPGGDHIMLMDLTEPLVAGDEVTFTLMFSDDSTVEFSAPVKDYSGANESYDGEDEEGVDEHEGHDSSEEHSGHSGAEG